MNSFSVIENLDVESSYKKNNFGFLLYSLVKIYKPINCYEFGILNGYSTISTACALRDNQGGILTAVDLFEDYEFKSNTFEQISQNINNHQLNDYVSLVKNDAFSEIENIEDNSIDFIHFDISNDGAKLKNFISQCYNKMKKNCIFIFEGGSVERDNVEWMTKFDKKHIRSLFDDSLFKENFDFFTLEPFPSLTICRKK